MGQSTPRSILFAAATGVTVLGALIGSHRAQQVAKPLIASSLLMGLDLRRNAALAIGLGAATVGDILLIDPDDDARLQRGAGSFAVMQVCYSALLVRRGARVTVAAAAPRAAGWIAATTLLARRSPAVAPTLASYGLLLAAISTLAASLPAADPGVGHSRKTLGGMVIPTREPQTWLAAGGVLFLLSDALIVVRRVFLRGERPRRIAEGVVLATYAGAQYLLVGGLRK